jgi:hypothetical protein
LKLTDKAIREAYSIPYQHGAINRLATACCVHRHHITKRAAELGLKPPGHSHSRYKKFKRVNWTADEIRIIQDNSTLKNTDLFALLKKQGCTRSFDALISKRLRMGWRDKFERDEIEVGYTSLSLAGLLGVNHTTVRRWVVTGMLKGKQEGDAGQGDRYRIQRRHVREFLINHIDRWDPGKPDKYWLMDVLIHP